MQVESMEYPMFLQLWQSRKSGIFPSQDRYQKLYNHLSPNRVAPKEDAVSVPTVEDLIKRYGSYRQAFYAFCDTYYRLNPVPIPDYLLGWLTGRARIATYKDRIFLRITEQDDSHVDLLKTWVPGLYVTRASKVSTTKYLRTTDYGFIFSVKHQWEPTLTDAFRPTLDFVRGYIEGHSYLQRVGTRATRLVLYGPLTDVCRTYLKSLGFGTSTRLYTSHQQYVRWNVHQKNLRKLRVLLYPSHQEYLCSPAYRDRLFQI
ncbi:MAG: hypothetical protein OWS03_06900 [Alicyclobacillaceae bacterium]|nr:hypothetical protein [Alicyclobacillaceae bacterium]